MTKDFYIAIRNHILNIGTFNFVQLWNNQLRDLEGKENNSYSFPLPACFVEFIAPQQVQQLGAGVQLFEPLIVRLHIVHEFLNNIDDTNGILEQDLDILTLKQFVYNAMQVFEPQYAVMFVRVAETINYDHNNVVEFIQDYQTNLIDNSHSDATISTPSPVPITLVPTFQKVNSIP
jgi:hypothetical protein